MVEWFRNGHGDGEFALMAIDNSWTVSQVTAYFKYWVATNDKNQFWDQVCTPTDHMKDWFSGLVMTNSSFGCVHNKSWPTRSSDWPWPVFALGRQNDTGQDHFTIGPDPGPPVRVGLNLGLSSTLAKMLERSIFHKYVAASTLST